MTLVSIITEALATIGRSTDAQSMEAWKQKFTIFANNGARDMAIKLQLRRTDTLTAVDNTIDISELPHDCIKILKVTQNGTELTFNQGPDKEHVDVGVDGDVEVEYRYLPAKMVDDYDQPGIPEHLQDMLVKYVVYNEHITADPNLQRRADPFYQDYMAGINLAKKTLGEDDTYQLYNTGWF